MFCICSSPAPPELMPGSIVFTIFAASGNRRTVTFAGDGLACPVVGDGAHAATVRIESSNTAASFLIRFPLGRYPASEAGAYAAVVPASCPVACGSAAVPLRGHGLARTLRRALARHRTPRRGARLRRAPGDGPHHRSARSDPRARRGGRGDDPTARGELRV